MTAIQTVIAKSRIHIDRLDPAVKTRGTKTQTVVIVAARIGTLISALPSMAADSASRP